MPPKTKFTKELILQIAFEMVSEYGFAVLTARAIADKLKSSTAPIYSCYPSMEELKTDLYNKVKTDLHDYCSKPYTTIADLNFGIGFVRFARDHKKIFQSLFLSGETKRESLLEISSLMIDKLKKQPEFLSISLEFIDEFLQRMLIFSQGYAATIISGLTADESDEAITLLQTRVGYAVGAALPNEKAYTMQFKEFIIGRLNPEFNNVTKILEMI